MQRDRFAAAAIWFENARIDRDLAGRLAAEIPARACFHARQAAEMSLKALLIALADDHPRTHVAADLVAEAVRLGTDVPEDVADAAIGLDLFYMSSRYPDALGGADPLKVLQATDAVRATERTSLVLAFVEHAIERARSESTGMAEPAD